MKGRMDKFDQDFKTKTIALSLKDKSFIDRIDGLLSEEFFSSEDDKYIFATINRHYQKYKTPPSLVSCSQTLKQDIESNILRPELIGKVKARYLELHKADISDKEFVIDTIADAARKDATIKAILEATDVIDSGGNIDNIPNMLQRALDVGAHDLHEAVDFSSNLEERIFIRRSRLNGSVSWNSITTGFKEFDAVLYRKGWGRGELTLYMGPSKSGKSIALIEHALGAAKAGFKVLFVSLEVSTEIQLDRMDANISGIKMNDIYDNLDVVYEKVDEWSKNASAISMHEFPTGTFTVSALRRLIKKRAALGQVYDLVVVDYADIMLSEETMQDGVERSKQVLVGLRALAQSENCAVLSATQTNRSGASVDLVEAIHVAEDYNKIRIADLVISINCNEIEREANEARLYFAASRNQAQYTITVERDLSRMRHIQEVKNVR